MTDRELLELAAKAAGIDVRWYQGDCLRVADKCNGFAGKWNPITDDGDALRLAVKLGFFSYEIIPEELSSAFLQSDPYAATRRAIVRAAAEIAKGMK